MDTSVLKEIDEVLLETGRLIKLDYIWPVNEEEEKEKFLKGKIKNPKFLYRNLEYSPKKVEKKLAALRLPESTLGRIYTEKIRRKLLSNKIAVKRGDENVVRETSIELHGVPAKRLVNYAETLLLKTPNVQYEKNVSSNRLKRAMEEALAAYCLDDWEVEATERKLASVYSTERKIKINRNGKFTENALKRLVVHEIEVHVLRAANGYRQPLKILALGLPGYLPTEEGLASYFEELTGNSDEEKMRDYAGRVVAVDSACKNLSFRKTYERLREYGFTEGKAWRLAIRVHRGGGYIKDHVYLAGYLKVKKFAEKNGDFKTLYIGKVSIENLPLVRKLLQQGVLKKAKYLPHFLK